jgi:inorganic triphosphatase YgiF
MGQELEVKYRLDSAAQLKEVLFSDAVGAVLCGPWREKPMRSVYYDTPDRCLRLRHWTLRFRSEGEVRVVCLKTPSATAYERNEFEAACPAMDASALTLLEKAGAPEELPALLAGKKLLPVCSAAFFRTEATLRFPDGTEAVISGDEGTLSGGVRRAGLCELEVELKRGCAPTMLQFCRELAARFSLAEEPKSKFARADALA